MSYPLHEMSRRVLNNTRFAESVVNLKVFEGRLCAFEKGFGENIARCRSFFGKFYDLATGRHRVSRVNTVRCSRLLR